MYLYWRIQQDLNCLGEVIRFHDPAFANAFHKWMCKNFRSIALAEGFYPYECFQVRHGKQLCRN